ncbi:MAG: Hsp70 family protein [Candidatus Latescibacteria bacterium]|nr:Hsp70 family protein [Candidatus Latescibacterota bacterium]
MNLQNSCSWCGWSYKLGDIFCGACGKQLAHLTFTPTPKLDLIIYHGLPLQLEIENTGEVPVHLGELETVGPNRQGPGLEWGEWVSPASLPAELDPGDKINLSRAHGGHPPTGYLILHSSATPVQYRYSVRQVPNIWLADLRSGHWAAGTADFLPCFIDRLSTDQSNTMQLRVEGDMVLEGDPRLEADNNTVSIRFDNPDDSFPLEVRPDKPFEFELDCHGELPEEGYPVRLSFPMKGLGEIIFQLNIRYSNKPAIEVNFRPSVFDGDDAVLSGSRQNRSVRVRMRHFGGEALTITQVGCDVTWLELREPQETIGLTLVKAEDADNSNKSQHKFELGLDPTLLPAVSQPTRFTAQLSIEGVYTGDQGTEVWRGQYPFVVVVRPLETLTNPIAVDFGTTNSCVAYFDPKAGLDYPQAVQLDILPPFDEVPTVFRLWALIRQGENLKIQTELKDNERIMMVDDKNRAIMQFGRDPYTEMLGSATNTDTDEFSSLYDSVCWGAKYALTHPTAERTYVDSNMSGITIDDHPLRVRRDITLKPKDLVAIFIRFLVERFIEKTGYMPRRVLLTFPAVFNRQKKALEEAAQAALADTDIVPQLSISEPEAIAINYVWQRRADINEMLGATQGDEGETSGSWVIGVFDCGGGTTDITIVKCEQEEKDQIVLEILGSDGDNNLGGDFLTYKIAEFIYQSVVPEQYQHEFQFASSLQEALNIRDDSIKHNFMALYNLAELLKTNSKNMEKFDVSFPDSQSNKGLLDQLEEEGEVPWPRILLADRSGNKRFDVRQSEIIIDDQPVGTLDPLEYVKIHDLLYETLKGGFDKMLKIQEALYDKELISDYRLDHLILAGNSSKLKIVEEVARDTVQAKDYSAPVEERTEQEAKVGVASGAVLLGMIQRAIKAPLSVRGASKLNYPIGVHDVISFQPIFDRWLPLVYGEKSDLFTSSATAMDDLPSEHILELVEYYDWDMGKPLRDGTGQVVASIPIPVDLFDHAHYWRYVLRLACDAKGEFVLSYNFEISTEKEEEFVPVYEEMQEYPNFVYS